MSDNQKHDGGKPRHDLIPWAEISPTRDDYSVQQVVDALVLWWTGRPFDFGVSVPARQLPGVAAVLGFGAAKYAPRGWEKGIEYSRVFAAAMRHALAHQAGETLDAESGLPHEAHLWCNVVFLLAFTARGRTDLDDRPAPAAASRDRLDRMQAFVAQVTGQSPVSGAGLVGGGRNEGAN
jgi:hypothetical protein